MDSWFWPQYLVALLMALGVIGKFIIAVRDRSTTSDRAVLIVFAWIAYVAAYSFVLHAGGFW